MKYGVDYASSQDAALLRALKESGRDFVCRYVSTHGNRKNLTWAEVAECERLKMGLVVVFETVADRALQGYAAGHYDAQSALEQLPPRMRKTAVVYFAVDFDARPEQQGAINAYLQGAAYVLGKNRTGVYGGYWVVSRALNAGIVKYAWQTYAWSGSAWDDRAQLRQYANGVRLCGIDVDLNSAGKMDYGQWPRPLVARVPTKAQLRAQILRWVKNGVPWERIKTTKVWRQFRAKGGK